MAERETVLAYAVDSNEWGTRVFGSAADLTYKRIIGLQYPDRKLWTPYGELQATEAQELKIDVNIELRDRLLGFFANYLNSSGCHGFANFMSTGEFKYETPHRAIVEDGSQVETLGMGQHGVMGYFVDRQWQTQTYAKHSISGLGHDTDQALQVTQFAGHLGLAAIPDLEKVWEPVSIIADSPLPYAYGLYAIPETASEDSFTE